MPMPVRSNFRHATILVFSSLFCFHLQVFQLGSEERLVAGGNLLPMVGVVTEPKDEKLQGQKDDKPRHGNFPDDFDYTINDGLYATITAMTNFEDPNFEKQITKLEVKLPEFTRSLEVRGLLQKDRAPLAVLILGLGTRGKSPFANLWLKHLHDGGYHAITFDSVFRTTFIERSRHGAPGNLQVEAEIIAKMIQQLILRQPLKDKVSEVGLVGISYGGTLTTKLAVMKQLGEIDLPITRALGFSPPISMQTAANLLDRYHREDRWKFTLANLYGELGNHKPVSPNAPIPFSAEQMRAGIAAAFRLDLANIVERTDRLYRLGALPPLKDFNSQYRLDVAETWTFERFIAQMVFPYWQKQGKVDRIESLWAMGDLGQLLSKAPDFLHIYLTPDDPLNDPEELESFRKLAPPERITMLPRGGHLGYSGTNWVKQRLNRLFE